MRIVLAILASMIVLGTRAQTHLPVPMSPYAAWQPFNPTFVSFDHADRHWQIRPYASLSAGVIFLNGGISYASAPAGLMLVRPLNNNLAAFTGLSVAPTVFNMSRLYGYPSLQTPFSGNYGLGLTTGIQGGLIYTNNDRTFSISGSISIERGSYPVYPAFDRPGNQPKSY